MFRADPIPIRTLLASLMAGLLAVSALTWAATTAPGFNFAAFGSFKRMIHSGDTGGQVKLVDLPQSPGNWGVGALAGLKGEVVLHDGRLLVSRGDDSQGRFGASRPDDEAVLFAAASVQQWVEVTLPSKMTQAQFQTFVVEHAKLQGMDVNSPFPFLVEGRYPKLTWHVVNGQPPPAGPRDAGRGGHANGRSATRVFEEANADGKLVGVYSGAQLEGVVSHPGERFHIHYVDAKLTVSGHVDDYDVDRGAVLKLPLR